MSPKIDLAYGRQNLDYVEALYQDFLRDPYAVDDHWRAFFQEEEAPIPAEPAVVDPREEQTGTFDAHLRADEHPIIHRAGDHTPVLELSDKNVVVDAIARIPLFQSIPRDHLELLADIAEEVTIESGQYISRSGTADNDLYLIRSGCVAILRDGREVTELSTGELIGELAVLDTRPRSADIYTKTRCYLLQIPRDQLHALLARDTELSLGLLRQLSIRLRDAGFRQERVDKLVRAYRERGHVMAELDPLGFRKGDHPELALEHYGFSREDLDTKFTVQLGRETSGRSLGDILANLQKIYCRAIGVQFMHIDNLEIQEWVRTRLEEAGGNYEMSRAEQIRILSKLTDAEVFETFLHRKFVGAKRFSLEGSESLIPLLDYAVEEAGNHRIDEVVIGMAHRGRLNVLRNVLGKPAAQIFREFQDVDPDLHRGGGDVKYHLGYGANRITQSGHNVHISLCFNPSHLEFVGPVAMGRVRAKQDRFADLERARALPLIIHGDAAFIGQGVTQEMLNMSGLRGYHIGGAVHVILNNQIGFTTDPEDSRSSRYCADVARMLQIPIFHVNGEHPEAVCTVIRLAMAFRETFKKDVVIDMYGYRKYGHNEGDDPEFTQPLLYAHIKKRKSVRDAFVDNMLELGEITKKDAKEIAESSKTTLEGELEESKSDNYEFKHISTGKGLWKDYQGGLYHQIAEADTAFPRKSLIRLLHKITEVPDGFRPNRKIARLLEKRRASVDGETPIDWGTGEALALASLLDEGTPVRFSGQDAQRGTFTHRHAVLHDAVTGFQYAPLAHIHPEQGRFEIINSPLTETAVLGFEYGYSLDSPESLVVWEAQFGDFCNVAQVIIDQFISSSEDKWRRLSGLTLLLPHGFEGQGPEHSSARLERFLMLSADDNMQVVNLTTPGQLFHCLRRQVLRKTRKPLVVMSPKSLLRHPSAVSRLDVLATGHFQKVIGDRGGFPAEQVKRILICSGKIYYELLDKREKDAIDNVAIVRLEQYYPLPRKELAEELSVYGKDVPVFWVQEEPLNMGALSFLKLQLGERIAGHPLKWATRKESASPATGSAASHKLEQEELIEAAFNLERTTCFPDLNGAHV